ncbi:MAG: DUF2460 domain-containing protein [Fluviibacter phosphoraccumulans]
MPITVINDIVVDCNIVSASVRGKQMRNNSRAMLFNGYGQVNINWTKTLRQYEIGFVPMPRQAWEYIEALHEATEGGAYGMLMVDPKDSYAAYGVGFLTGYYNNALYGSVGAGAGVPTYKISKRYTVTGTAHFKDRYITRPASPIAIKLGATVLTAGAGDGQYSVNYDTGTVTMVKSASAAVSSFTAGATTTLTFASGVFPALFSIGGRLWVQSATGTLATSIVQKPLTILGVSGNNIIVDVVSTGMTLTSATCYRYPQPNETFAWQGDFYVPVHFIDDSIDWELSRGGDYDDRIVAGPSCVLLEIRE